MTIQLPLYNERYVVERLIEEVLKIDYPRELLQIQVLDDSTDDTAPFAEALVERYRTMGYPIEYHHRDQSPWLQSRRAAGRSGNRYRRIGGGVRCRFLPARRFSDCARCIFFADPKVGVVQTRWSYLNRDYNFLTEVEAMLLDGHFILEHGARSRAGYFFNFNGTAGILRARHDRRRRRLAARHPDRRFRPQLSRPAQRLALCVSARAWIAPPSCRSRCMASRSSNRAGPKA